jgi:hypothetical protein
VHEHPPPDPQRLDEGIVDVPRTAAPERLGSQVADCGLPDHRPMLHRVTTAA